MSRRKGTSRAKLKAANQKEQLHIWKEHFMNLLGNSPKITDKLIPKIINGQLDIKLEQFTQELKVALTKIKSQKATGLDETPPEVWMRRKFDDLLGFCNAAYKCNTI